MSDPVQIVQHGAYPAVRPEKPSPGVDYVRCSSRSCGALVPIDTTPTADPLPARCPRCQEPLYGDVGSA